MNCQLAPFNLRALTRVDLFTKSQDSIEPFALFLLEWGNSKANIFSSKVVHLHCSFRFQWDLTHWSLNQVCPDIYIFETSLACSRFRSFNIAPWFQIYFWVQDKAKSCNWPQVDEIGGWEGGRVGGWEGGRGGEVAKSGPTSRKPTEASNVPAMLWGLNLEQVRQCQDWAKLAPISSVFKLGQGKAWTL